jgi:hypothetical protein
VCDSRQYKILTFPLRPDRLRTLSSSYEMGMGALSAGVKRQEREAHYSSLSSAEVKKI